MKGRMLLVVGWFLCSVINYPLLRYGHQTTRPAPWTQRDRVMCIGLSSMGPVTLVPASLHSAFTWMSVRGNDPANW